MSYLDAEWMSYWLDVYEGKYGRQVEERRQAQLKLSSLATGTLRNTTRRSYHGRTRKEQRATEWATSYATKR